MKVIRAVLVVVPIISDGAIGVKNLVTDQPHCVPNYGVAVAIGGEEPSIRVDIVGVLVTQEAAFVIEATKAGRLMEGRPSMAGHINSRAVGLGAVN